eukprot:g38184.t1
MSGNETLCENLFGYVHGILKPIVQGNPSFCCDTTDFLQKLSTHGLTKPGTFLVTMDVSAFYTSIPYNDGITATALFLIQTYETAIGTRLAPQYFNIFMHKFEHDFFAVQHLRPMLYTRYVGAIFFLLDSCTSLYRKPTDNLTMLHFSIFHPKYVKEAIPYGQALHVHRICSDEEECDRHLKVLKDAH